MRIFNENIGYNLITTEEITFEQHNKWWEKVFDKEFIYIVLYETEICGYIRLTKFRTESKEQNEISIAIAKRFQNAGMGSYTFEIFETEMKKFGINQIIAITDIRNHLGQKFFEKNNFKKSYIRYVKKI